MESITENPIFPESEESAKFVKCISGWVDRNGIFFGQDERSARYSGSTHKNCPCGESVPKLSFCKKCHRNYEIEKHKNAERIEWDRETPLYSQLLDDYIFSEEDLIDLMNEFHPKELELFICDPIFLKEFKIDYWDDYLPEDGELPSEIIQSIEVLNSSIRKLGPVNWEPGKYAAEINFGVK